MTTEKEQLETTPSTFWQRYYTVVNQIGSVQMDAENPFAKSKYAPLSTIQNSVNPVLADHRFVFFTEFNMHNGDNSMYILKATLRCVDTGECNTWLYDIPFDHTQKNPVQGFGSTSTYGRRYAYAMVFNIAFDNDDPDSGNTTGSNCEKADEDKRPWLNKNTKDWDNAVTKLKSGSVTMEKISEVYKINKTNRKELELCQQ